MDKYIKWDLENNPQFFRQPHSGKFVDMDVIRHVVCNVNQPNDVSEEVFMRVLNAVAEEVSMIPPVADVAQVVRCQECIHWADWGACGHPDNGFDAPRMGPDDFCSKGKREEEKFNPESAKAEISR